MGPVSSLRLLRRAHGTADVCVSPLGSLVADAQLGDQVDHDASEGRGAARPLPEDRRDAARRLGVLVVRVVRRDAAEALESGEG